jgi:hypothetical protein
MRVVIKKSTNKDKKMMAIFYDEDGKKLNTSHFGSAGMNDYTLTGDKEARKRYRERHAKDLDTKDYKRPGYLSYYILWGDSTSLQENIKNYKKRFKLK